MVFKVFSLRDVFVFLSGFCKFGVCTFLSRGESDYGLGSRGGDR